MTREEAKTVLYEWQKSMVKHGVPLDTSKVQALRVAIEALQADRPHGTWRKYAVDGDVYDLNGVHTWGVEYQCPFCGQIHTLIEGFGQWNFCPECGADMKGGNK